MVYGKINFISTIISFCEWQRGRKNMSVVEFDDWQKRKHKFTFVKSDMELESAPGWNVAELLDLEDTQMYQAAFLGRCMTLFGKPYDTTDNHEALYTYYIRAVSENGNEIPLEIYFGPSGPAIGVPDGKKEKQAAVELAKTIMKTKPMDCSIQSGYDDTSVRIIMGVKDGVPFYRTLFPGMSEDMTEEEIQEFMKNLFRK